MVQGVLKLTNFCLSRLHDENLLEVYSQAYSQTSQDFSSKYNADYSERSLMILDV